MDLDTSHFEIPLVQKVGGRILFLKSYQKVQAAIKLEGGGALKNYVFFGFPKHKIWLKSPSRKRKLWVKYPFYFLFDNATAIKMQ